MKSCSQKHRRLGLESLENRDLMAGNVRVSFANGDLVVRGDDAANLLTITPLGGSRFEVKGAGGTTLNGRTTPVSGSITDDVIIRLFGGNDRLVIGSQTRNTVFTDYTSIDMGAGADFTTLYRVRGMHGVTSMGADSENDVDTLNVRRSIFRGDAVVRMGGGNDEANLLRAQALANLKVFAGSGDDSVTISNSKAGNVRLDCGAGDDYAFFSGTNEITGNLLANGGSGEDNADQAPGTLYLLNPKKTHDAVNFEGGNAEFPDV